MQMIWAVELIDAGTYAGDVRAFLEEAGVRPFIWKSRVDTAALKEALEWRYPKVAWVEVGWRGTVLQVRLVEGTPMGETVDWHGSQDIVASRDGVVVSVVPLAGTAMCKPGDTVRQGQVLIAGEEREGTDGTRPCPPGESLWPGYGRERGCRFPCGKPDRIYGRDLSAAVCEHPLVQPLAPGRIRLCAAGYTRGDHAPGRPVPSPMGAPGNLPGGAGDPVTWRDLDQAKS